MISRVVGAKAVVVQVLLVGALVGGWANDAAAHGTKPDATATSARSSAPLPPRQRARLNAAVHRGFREAAAPGVIVGVQTPKGKWVKAIGIANERSKSADEGEHASTHWLGDQDLHRYAADAARGPAQALAQRQGQPVHQRSAKRRHDDPPPGRRHDERSRQLHRESSLRSKRSIQTRSGVGVRASCSGSVCATPPCSAREPPSNTPTATTCCSGW